MKRTYRITMRQIIDKVAIVTVDAPSLLAGSQMAQKIALKERWPKLSRHNHSRPFVAWVTWKE